ncbi:MAG: alpha/beta fold hydrolase BchO, partial [Pseudomonadota bacterium]
TTLPGMAAEVSALLRCLSVTPELLVGHSAGAAIATRMALDAREKPRGVIALNGAFGPYGGVAGALLAPLAGLCAASGLVARLIARQAEDLRALERVIAGTGSTIDRAGLRAYQAVLRKPAHVSATFAMMANWDLSGLLRAMPAMELPLALYVADGDKAVPAHQARALARRCANVSLRPLPGLGHLAHEEDPPRVAELIVADAEALDLL